MALYLEIILAIWGLFSGFVCWPACSRLSIPISDWLVPRKKHKIVAFGICYILTLLFLISATFAVFALLPLIVRTMATSEIFVWRSAFGIVYFSSIVGFLVQASMVRFFGPDPPEEDSEVDEQRNEKPNLHI